MQYNTIQYNMQYNTLQCNSAKENKRNISKTSPNNTMLHYTVKFITQLPAIQCNKGQ